MREDVVASPWVPHRTTRADAACLLFYLLLSLIFCQRVFSLTDWGTHAIYEGDPALANWVINWVGHAWLTEGVSWNDGNAFFPHSNSIALAESMPSLALLNLPFQLIFESPWVGYNALILAAYWLSAWGAYAFVRELTGSRPAACWGGLFYGFMFFRMHHIGHLQILSYQWIPFAALHLVRLLRYSRPLDAVLLAVYFVLQALVSWYLAVIAALILGLVALTERSPWRATPRSAVLLAGAALVSVSILLPFARPYTTSFESSSLRDRIAPAGRASFSAGPMDYLHPPSATFFGGMIDDNRYWIWQENTLYIGMIPLGLALVGAIGARLLGAQREAEEGPSPQRLVAGAIGIAMVGYVLSLGFSSSSGADLPLAYLARLAPFLSGMRATPRFAMLVYFGVLVLSSLGVSLLWLRLGERWRVPSIAALALLFLVEVFPLRLPFGPLPAYVPSELDRAIGEMQREAQRPLTVLNLPIYRFTPEPRPNAEARYMLASTYHWAPILNGYSGGTPDGYLEDMKLLDGIPAAASLARARELGVDLLALHPPLSQERRARIVARFEGLEPARLRRFEDGGILIRFSEHAP